MKWSDDTETLQANFESPFLLFKDGKLTHLVVATGSGNGSYSFDRTWNMVIPLKQQNSLTRMKSLKNVLLRYCDFSSNELELFFSYCQRKDLKRDFLFLRKGQKSDVLVFIESGMLSIFMDNDDE
ncbi:hypothetical protein [Chryseobacterium sp. JK1]|uniref:hypothetical protein n=1 Tax=Chryseobacterium sp. JK1 TaxID=874294 RepID=UPI003D68BA68